MDALYGTSTRIEEIKATDDGWTVAGYVSTYGNVDHTGDVVMAGAFDSSVSGWKAGEHKIRFLNAHRTDQILGRPLEFKSDEKGLRGTFKISKTSYGQDIHTLLKDQALDAFSIGYVPTEVEFTDEGIRKLLSVDLLEVSVVAIPANEKAAVTAVKTSADGAESKAEWSAAFVNDLPDSAFALILPGGSKDESGRTAPRSLRKLPHHGSGGGVDLPHLRNALARAPQMTGVSDSQRSRAVGHLNTHAKSAGVGSGGKEWGAHSHDDEDVLDVLAGLVLGIQGVETLAQSAVLDDGQRAAIGEMVSEAKADLDRLVALVAPRIGPSDLRINLDLARARARRLGVELPV